VRTAELQLLKAIGDRMDATLDLTDPLETDTVDSVDAARAVETAFMNRPEMRAQALKVESAGLGASATRAEWIPNIQGFANYGSSGNPDSFVPTRAIGVQLNVPVFDSGRRRARRVIAASQLRQAEVRARDVRDEIELDVRTAVDSLASALEQLRSAERSLMLAQEELELSRLRFEAQVATQIDVINAQVELVVARTRNVNALFTLRAAQVEYERATGAPIR
jgi:outer membrane protein TolC